ncbi:MAG TPA: FtsQ-type POTRA domain-containing protein [Bryobacteraceae bacterium]
MPRQPEKKGLLGGLFPGVSWARFTFWLVAGVLLMVSTLFAWHRTEEVLIGDNRFRVAEADDLTGPSPNLIVEGIHYASASQIRHVFAKDLGRSLYLVPIQMRRQQLLEIDWVADATVSKVWPNTLRVQIHERVPAAFVRLPPARKDGPSTFALIDQDGMILRPRVAAQFTLPVIAGIREDEPLHDRRARVRRALGMLKDVGPLAAQVAEVDVTDPNNLIITEHVANGALSLIIGDENYASRLQNFLASYSQIKEKRPDATTLDLRVDGAITAVGDKHFER